MNFIERVLRFLFWLLVLSWSVWLLKKALGWMLNKAVGPGPEAGYGTEKATGNAQDALTARKLVRDPVCGVYVAEVLAIPMREGGELVHFCSTECRDKYAANMQRVAANG